MSQLPRFSKEEIVRRLEEDFERYTSEPLTEIRSLPPPMTFDQSILAQIEERLDKLNWLSEGPDSYDVIDDTVGPSGELTYRFDPFLLWAVSLTNTAAAGGGNILLRFTADYGRIKQYKVRAATTVNLSDMKGGMGNSFKVVTDAGSIEMVALVTLKWPYTSRTRTFAFSGT